MSFGEYVKIGSLFGRDGGKMSFSTHQEWADGNRKDQLERFRATRGFLRKWPEMGDQ